MKKIDLNCDMGESFGAYRLGMDDAVIQFISIPARFSTSSRIGGVRFLLLVWTTVHLVCASDHPRLLLNSGET